MPVQSDSIQEWREQYARRHLRVDFEPLPGSTFHASVKPILPELRIVRAALSPGFLFRDDDLLRDGDDSIGFVIAQSRELTARHLGRELQLAPGDATMMLMSATGGVGWRESSTLFDMLTPPTEWEARGARSEDVLMQRLWGKSEAMQLLRCYDDVSTDNRVVIAESRKPAPFKRTNGSMNACFSRSSVTCAVNVNRGRRLGARQRRRRSRYSHRWGSGQLRRARRDPLSRLTPSSRCSLRLRAK